MRYVGEEDENECFSRSKSTHYPPAI